MAALRPSGRYASAGVSGGERCDTMTDDEARWKRAAHGSESDGVTRRGHEARE